VDAGEGGTSYKDGRWASSSRGGPSHEFGDEGGGSGGTVGLHRLVVDGAADLGGDRVGDGVGSLLV